ncbi:MAG TPA: hypothetical protein VGN76_10080 [Gemmatimonadales bacterium]|jgi:hypothetical protein|nr:hypothetical protein [Gemmatimonadales bacterium]
MGGAAVACWAAVGGLALARDVALAVLPVMMTLRQRRRAESDRGIHD